MSKLLCCLLLACCAGLGHAQQVPKPVPVAAFVGHDQFSRPRLSPDGKHIAVTTRMPSGERTVSTVTIYSLPDLKIAGVVRLPVYEIPVSYVWLTNTRMALTKGRELGDREAPVSTGEIMAFNIDGSRQEYLYGYNMFSASLRGEQMGDDYGIGFIDNIPRPRNAHLYLNIYQWKSEHSMLYDINSLNASRKLMADIDQPYLTFLQQRDGVPRLAHGTDEHQKSLVLRRDAGGNWIRQDNAAYGSTFRALDFTLDDKAYVALYSAGGEPQKLIRQQIDSGERVTLAENAVGNINLLEYDHDGLPFAAGTESTGVPGVNYIDAGHPDAALHKSLSQQFPGSYVHFINYTDDGMTLLFSVRSDRDPGSYYLYDKTSNNADLLFSSKPGINPEDMAERRPIRFKARDGLDLYGYLTVPKHAANKKLPMVLMPHGGPHGVQDTWTYDNDAQFLASRGYVVLQVNFRGSAGRGQNFTEAGYREWAGKIQDDLIDGVNWTLAQGEVDEARLCVYGVSFGAYSALTLAARQPAVFKCALAYAGVYDLPAWIDRNEVKSDKHTKNILYKYLGDDVKELERISPVNLAADIAIPVLLVHGGMDKVAPVAQAEKMRAALIKANRPPQWMLADTEGHGFYNIKNNTALLEKMQAFLEQHIGH